MIMDVLISSYRASEFRLGKTTFILLMNSYDSMHKKDSNYNTLNKLSHE